MPRRYRALLTNALTLTAFQISRTTERYRTPMGKPIEMTGGEALARMLALADQSPMFGMGGFQLLPFYDAASRCNLNHNLINDERAGVFAADAFAKLTNRPGLADATLGPGATNLVTGLIEALNAGTPMVVLVGDSHRDHCWKNMTQESRQMEILRPAVKELIRIETVHRIPELVRRAFAVATSGRPGPVVLDVPEDVAHELATFDDNEFQIEQQYLRSPSMRSRPAVDVLDAAVTALCKAARPLILAGGGVHLSEASDALQAFVEAENIPVAHTMTGKGSIACTHPLSAGLFGRYDRIANRLIEKSDCLLVVGCKLGEIATKRFSIMPKNVPMIHVDTVAEEMNRTTPASICLWGDARETLRELSLKMNDSERGFRHQKRAAYTSEVSTRMKTWYSEVQERLTSEEVPISMARMLHEINNVMPADGVLVADGGFAAHWGGLLFDTKEAGRGFVPDRGFASIGYGVPGAIGAALARPRSHVISLTGDGGFNMSMGELETARRMGLAFTLIIVNNAASGYVKALQHLMYGENQYQSSDLSEINYADLANTLGCSGIRVEQPGELNGALRQGLENRTQPTVIDCVVTRDPAKMLPGVDSRTVSVKKGDRVA